MPRSEKQTAAPDKKVAKSGAPANIEDIMLHTSAGVLAFRLPDMKQVLIIQHRANNQWSFPKGHVEDYDASLQDAALREFEEETTIPKSELRLVPDWKQETEFVYRCPAGKWQKKTVHWFCGVLDSEVSGEPTPETIECRWQKIAALWSKLRRREAMAVARKAAKSVKRHFGSTSADRHEAQHHEKQRAATTAPKRQLLVHSSPGLAAAAASAESETMLG